MALSSSWRQLEAADLDGNYMIKYDFTNSQTRVSLTDLRELWAETLPLEVFLARAEETSCPIDAREDADQRRILLETLAQALNGAKGTSVALHRRDRDDTFVLKLEADLPEPLPELVWHFVLTPKGSEYFFDEVTGQLIQGLHQKDIDVANLQDIITGKDNVIKKLLDRLESMGTDLTTVFPGTSALRPSSKIPGREQLGRHVKGLQPFQPRLWKSSEDLIEDRDYIPDILASVDHNTSSSLRTLLERHDQASPSTGIGKDRGNNERGDGTVGTAEATESEDDDDFQVQELSPEKGNTTATDVGGNSPPGYRPDNQARSRTLSASSRLSSEAPEQSHNKPRARIGTIGRKPAVKKAHDPQRMATSSPEPTQPPASRNRIEPPRRSKLGVLRGRSDKKSESSPASKSASTRDPVPPHRSKAAASGRSDTAIDSPPPKTQERGRAAGRVKQEPSPVRETSKERADRRREELKRQIETNPAGAQKKRRKF